MSTGLLINIGCGQHAASGWMNIDRTPNAWLAKHRWVKGALGALRVLPESTYQTRYRDDLLTIDVAKRGLPVADGAASWIYCSHLISSMTREQALALACECARALAPGGRFRVVDADLSALAEGWRHKIEAYKRGDRAFFDRWDGPGLAIGDCLVRSLGLELFTRANLNKLQMLFNAPVQHFYDFDSLSALLRQAGFREAVRSDYRQGGMPDIALLDVHPGSLHVEAAK